MRPPVSLVPLVSLVSSRRLDQNRLGFKAVGVFEQRPARKQLMTAGAATGAATGACELVA